MISSARSAASGISGRNVLTRRMEFKYLVDRTTRTGLAQDLAAIMRPDPYSGPDGTYHVRSVYLDAPGYMAYHDKLAGVAKRHKCRIRAYGDASADDVSTVRLEVKSRYLNFIRKTILDIPRGEYDDIGRALRDRTLPPARLLDDPELPKEFFRLQRQYNMEPKILVQYRRQAFERTEIDRIRVNFDDEIVSTADTKLFGPLAGARRLLRYGHAVFEIKIDGVMPSWLHTLIGKYDLQNQAFSKYCHAVRCAARLSSTPRSAFD